MVVISATVVSGYPELYDTTCLLYRDRNKKEQAWVKDAEETGLLGKFCKYVSLISLQNGCTTNVSASLAPVSTAAGFPATRANDAMTRINKMVRRRNSGVTGGALSLIYGRALNRRRRYVVAVTPS